MSNLLFKEIDSSKYEPNKDILESTGCKALLSNTSFQNKKDHLAIIGCGGTISSVYSPLHESIHATNHSPIVDLIAALGESFGICEKNITYLPLINKDSRQVSKDDITFLLDFLNSIENERVIVTFGTYGIPMLTKIIADNISRKNKIVVVTGSMLPSAFREQDADVNGLSAITCVNTIAKMRELEKDREYEPLVFSSFHGKVFTAVESEKLDLHPESHANVKFYRGVRFRTE